MKNRGRIGLPLRRAQSRNALVMSAIEEERASAEMALSSASKKLIFSSSSPTSASSSFNSSPDQDQVTGSNQASLFETLTDDPLTEKKKVSSDRSRSVANFEDDERPSTATPSQAPKRMTQAQSARMRSAQRLASVPMAGVIGITSAVAKQMKSYSARSRSIPNMKAGGMTTNSPTLKVKEVSEVSDFDSTFLHEEAQQHAKKDKKTKTHKKSTKFHSERSQSASYYDDLTLDENITLEAKKRSRKEKIKTSKSVRARPVSNFEDLGSSGPLPQKEAWKPRALKPRPASGPTTFASSFSKLSSSSKSVQDGIDPSAPLVDQPIRSKPSKNATTTTETTVQQPQSLRRFSPDEDFPATRYRASSDGGGGLQQMLEPSDKGLFRARALSDSGSSNRKKHSYLRIRHYEGKFLNRRGQSLLYFSLFPPEKLAMRGIVLHLHGMGDHCRRNIALYERYCKEGFGVITYDLVNHGASDYDKSKTRAHISNFNELVDDTNDFITFAKATIYKDALRYWRKHHHPHHPHGKERKRQSLPELPLIITGTSFGSLIGLHTVLMGKQKFHAAVWASPSIGVTWTPVLWAQWKFAKALVTAFPTAKMIPAVQHHLRSRNPEFLARFQEDPLTSSDMITPRTGCQALEAMIRLQRDTKVSDADSPFCAIPMLFLAGTDDRVSDQQAAYKFYTRMGSIDKEFKFFEGLYHMIYEEPEREDVLTYLISWLHKRFPLETRQPIRS
ncbi:hypothetical protein CCR75_006052 [Bremia lactucae]|uniref:Serine aminopeptidase S33 domain-containing protein n=1 Tax=Bremia lactucae TaxID=4779 RepID=A0A976IGL8_BRELC|nr:hypothetical protein CCR75_006052 [Bremia lactucae]